MLFRQNEVRQVFIRKSGFLEEQRTFFVQHNHLGVQASLVLHSPKPLYESAWPL